MNKDCRLLYESYQGKHPEERFNRPSYRQSLKNILSKSTEYWTSSDHTYAHNYMVMGVNKLLKGGERAQKLYDLGFDFSDRGVFWQDTTHYSAHWEPTVRSPAMDVNLAIDIQVDSDHTIRVVLMKLTDGDFGDDLPLDSQIDFNADPLGRFDKLTSTLKQPSWDKFTKVLDKLIDSVSNAIRDDASEELSDWDF